MKLPASGEFLSADAFSAFSFYYHFHEIQFLIQDTKIRIEPFLNLSLIFQLQNPRRIGRDGGDGNLQRNVCFAYTLFYLFQETTGLSDAHSKEFSSGCIHRQASLTIGRNGDVFRIHPCFHHPPDPVAYSDFITDSFPVIDIFVAGKINISTILCILSGLTEQFLVPVDMSRKNLRGRYLGLCHHALDQIHASRTVPEMHIDNTCFS